jgi:hypothetical protein
MNDLADDTAVLSRFCAAGLSGSGADGRMAGRISAADI